LSKTLIGGRLSVCIQLERVLRFTSSWLAKSTTDGARINIFTLSQNFDML